MNCNSIHSCTKSEFGKAYNNNQISFIGEISDNHYDQILKGIQDSPMVENDIKEILPSSL